MANRMITLIKEDEGKLLEHTFIFHVAGEPVVRQGKSGLVTRCAYSYQVDEELKFCSIMTEENASRAIEAYKDQGFHQIWIKEK